MRVGRLLLFCLALVAVAGCGARGRPQPAAPSDLHAQDAAWSSEDGLAIAEHRAARARIVGTNLPVAAAMRRCPERADQQMGRSLQRTLEVVARRLSRSDAVTRAILRSEQAAAARRLSGPPTAQQCAEMREELGKTETWLRTQGA